MSYVIHVTDVEAAVSAEGLAAQRWYEAAQATARSLERPCSLPCMQGSAADALRLHVAECLAPVIQAAGMVAQEYQIRLLLYQDAWHTAEPASSGVLPEGEMEGIEDRVHSYKVQASWDSEEISGTMRRVADLVSLPSVSDQRLMDFYDRVEHAVASAREKCGGAEAQGKRAFSDISSLVAALESYVSKVSQVKVGGYVPGSLLSSTEGVALAEQLVAAETRIDAVAEQIGPAEERERAFAQARAEEEAAQRRLDQGTQQLTNGLLLLVVAAAGTAAIVGTGGAATPLVALAVAGGAGGTAVFAASNAYEGAQNVYYGSIGDATSIAVNPGRDWLFGGNQQAWDMFGTVSMLAMSAGGAGAVASRFAAASGAGTAGRAMAAGRAAAADVALNVGGDAAGQVVTNAVVPFIGRDKAAALGVGVSFALGMASPDASDLARAGKLGSAAGDAARGAEAAQDAARAAGMASDAERAAVKLDGNADDLGRLSRGLDGDASDLGHLGRDLTDELPESFAKGEGVVAGQRAADASKVGDDLVADARKNAGTANGKLATDVQRAPGGSNTYIPNPDSKGLDGLTTTERIESEARVHSSIKEFESNGPAGYTNVQKGNYGEMKAHEWLVAQGWERVGTPPVESIYAKGHHGIDGIYFKADERPPWLVIEAKYGKGKLNLNTMDGHQMSYTWIDNRLEDAAGSEELAETIRGIGERPEYGRAEIHINADGSVERREIPWS